MFFSKSTPGGRADIPPVGRPDRRRRFVHRDRVFLALVVCSAVCSGGNSAMLSMPIHRFRSSVAAGFAPCPNPRAAAGWGSVQALGTNCLQRSLARPIIPPHELIAAMQLAAARPFENLRSRGRLQRPQRPTTGLLDSAITASSSGRSLPQITERLGFLLGRLRRGASRVEISPMRKVRVIFLHRPYLSPLSPTYTP
jgi:hypothetical protein